MRSMVRPLLAASAAALLSLTLALSVAAQTFKVNDRVLAPYGGGRLAATIVGGPNSRGEWRVHYDKTDSQRDKWLTPRELLPLVELGEVKPGDMLQVEIMSAWQWCEAMESNSEEVLCHAPGVTHEKDAWLPKDKIRRPPPGETPPPAWKWPYLNGDYVYVNKGGPQPELGPFQVNGEQVYVGDYRVSDIRQIVGPWEPRFQPGMLARRRATVIGTWEQVRIDQISAGGYDVTWVRNQQTGHVTDRELVEDWDYEGFAALAAPLFSDNNPLKMTWLLMVDQGQMQQITVRDDQLKAAQALMTKVEAQLRAKYKNFPGGSDCRDCPAQIMDVLARRKQILMKACGMDVQRFVQGQLESYQMHLDNARQGRFWEVPFSFGAQDVVAAVRLELKEHEKQLQQEIARNKLIDPAFSFHYDPQPIFAQVESASAEFAKLLPTYQNLSSDMSRYAGHDASAEALALKYFKGMEPKAKILGVATLEGGWKKEIDMDINTARTRATFTRRQVASVVIKASVPGYKYPMAISMTLYREGGAPYVHPNSVLQAFYRP